MIQPVEFNFVCNTYTRTQIVEIEKNCNSITVTNTGGCAVTVKGITLYPGTVGSILGDSFSVGGNLGEVLTDRRMEVAFAVGGVTPAVQIIQKFYR